MKHHYQRRFLQSFKHGIYYCPDYMHAKHFCRGLYVKNDTLLLADVLKNFWKICHENYGLDLACSFIKDQSYIRYFY